MHIYKLSPIFSAAVLLSAGVASAETKFFYNQVGYDTGLPINVIVRSDNSLDGAEFKLISNGNPVKSGKLSSGTNPDNWLNNGMVRYFGKNTVRLNPSAGPAGNGE